MKFIYCLTALALAILTVSCQTKTSEHAGQTLDSAAIASGEAIFKQDCSACHTFDRDAIGPRLGGITAAAPAEWLARFIADPKKMIESGDERSNKLYNRFKTMMPSFSHYDQQKQGDLLAFLKSKEDVSKTDAAEDPNALKDPIPAHIPMSGLVAELKLVASIPFSSEEMPRTRIVKLEVQPGSNKLMVLDLRGKLYDISNGTPVLYFDMATVRPDFIHKPGLATGFGSVAFHPDFSSNARK